MKQRYLDNVQVLRGIAALMVVVAHSFGQFSNHPIAGMRRLYDRSQVNWGTGVDIFFVISGFIMLYLTYEHFAKPGYPAEFIKRRIIRVVPPYWIMTTLMVIAATLLPGTVNHGATDWWHVVASYLFFPAPRVDGVLHPVLGLGWTLNFEFFFYAVFALALFVPRAIGLTAVVVLFVLLAVLHPLMPTGPLSFWSDPIILDFLVGMGAALLFVRGVKLTERTTLMLLAAALALFVVVPRMAAHEWFRPVPAMIVATAGILAHTRAWPRLLLYMGDSSYALYLTHPFALNLTTFVWRKLHLPLWSGAYLVALVVACIATGMLAYRFGEVPLLALLRRRFEPKRDLLSA